MTDLSVRAEALQAEAHTVLRQLDLETAFPSFGPAQPIGSALSGLMVLRDLDVMFTAPDATATEVLRGLATIAERPGLLTADFRDERDDRRPTPQTHRRTLLRSPHLRRTHGPLEDRPHHLAGGPFLLVWT